MTRGEPVWEYRRRDRGGCDNFSDEIGDELIGHGTQFRKHRGNGVGRPVRRTLQSVTGSWYQILETTCFNKGSSASFASISWRACRRFGSRISGESVFHDCAGCHQRSIGKPAEQGRRMGRRDDLQMPQHLAVEVAHLSNSEGLLMAHWGQSETSSDGTRRPRAQVASRANDRFRRPVAEIQTATLPVEKLRLRPAGKFPPKLRGGVAPINRDVFGLTAVHRQF